MSDHDEIKKIIYSFFEAGRTKDLSPLRSIQLNDSRFSSFSDVPPYELKDYSTTLALEELRFVSISDYNYQIKELKVDFFGDNFAIATFLVEQTGMIVDNKAFTGKTMSINSRATFVFMKSDSWKIIHMHTSQIPQ